jgi:hypothetical protein
MPVICRTKGRAWEFKLTEIIFGFVSRLMLGVELLIVVGLVDVELIWTDSNDGT